MLDKLPKGKQPKAKRMLRDIWQAETREEAKHAFDAFVEDYQSKHPKTFECLVKDRDELLAFDTPFRSFGPAEHWRHLRTTNPIESTFATIRLRHKQTKGCGSRTASLTMVFKLADSASPAAAPSTAARRSPTCYAELPSETDSQSKKPPPDSLRRTQRLTTSLGRI